MFCKTCQSHADALALFMRAKSDAGAKNRADIAARPVFDLGFPAPARPVGRTGTRTAYSASSPATVSAATEAGASTAALTEPVNASISESVRPDAFLRR